MDSCPHCGADLPPKAKTCPECGSDEKTGWSEQARTDHVGLPDDDFDHEDFVQRELGVETLTPRGIHWFWWLVAVLLVVGMLLFSLR